ncbi:MAG: hypothetical protein IKP72_04110 [Clostridia bacterium]|nr:hypothetical protein [Clostridia bacterium]
MGKRKGLLILLLAAALALSGCVGQTNEAAPTAGPENGQEQAASAMAQAQGELGDAVRKLLEPYTDALSQAAEKSGESLAYTIPGDLLNQMALDAEAEGIQAKEGRWRFTRRDSGAYAYEATAWEAMDQYVPEDGPTPNPADETPLDSQLNGDYAVSGGGLFERTRDYDVAEDLSGGTVTLTDSLNGQPTGSELFRFCVRSGELIFADAALDTTVQDGAATGDGYLAAVGALRADGLEVVEYRLTSLDELPDPAALNFSSFLRTVSPISHLSIQTEKPSK